MYMIKAGRMQIEFLRAHSVAAQFAQKAAEDYLLARVGIQDGLWSAFEIASQATEKLLKAYLLFRNPALNGNAKAAMQAIGAKARLRGRRYNVGHDVEAAFELSINLGMPSPPALEKRIAKINAYYDLRYPDLGAPMSLGTDEVNDLDESIFHIWDAFKPLDDDYFYLCGIPQPILISFMHPPQHYIRRRVRALTGANLAYRHRQADIEAGIRNRI